MAEKNRKEEMLEKVQQPDAKMQELTESELDQVTGAGNPFDDVPRVPTQPIDKDTRNRI